MPQSPRQSPRATSALAQHPLLSLLESHQSFMQLQAGMQQIAALTRDLAALLPDYLISHVSPGLLQGGILNLFTTHNACAARLRHLVPNLTQGLQQRGWLIQTLKIRVRPQLIPSLHQSPPTKTAHLSTTGLTQLHQLSQQLEPSPLQDSLRQMVTHHQTAFSARAMHEHQ